MCSISISICSCLPCSFSHVRVRRVSIRYSCPFMHFLNFRGLEVRLGRYTARKDLTHTYYNTYGPYGPSVWLFVYEVALLDALMFVFVFMAFLFVGRPCSVFVRFPIPGYGGLEGEIKEVEDQERKLLNRSSSPSRTNVETTTHHTHIHTCICM